LAQAGQPSFAILGMTMLFKRWPAKAQNANNTQHIWGGIRASAVALTLVLGPSQIASARNSTPAAPPAQTPDNNPLLLGTAREQTAAMAEGRITSEMLTRAYLQRIAAIDDSGPQINAVLALFPDAIDQAIALDAERRAGKIRSPLHGVPILIKDNIEVAGPVPTTAGSLALKDNITNRDATLVAKLRAAGMVILGKTNLSEWANIRSSKSTSGWSALGGLTRNPHKLDHNACGSSSGSGAAVAARLASFAIGTETDGSIVCPSGTNGIVGFKPTVGLVSRRFIVPISRSQDTAGPMTRSVRDAAMLLDVIAGGDIADPATYEADMRRENYAAALERANLAGMRIGYVKMPGANETLMNAAIARLEMRGATMVPINMGKLDMETIGEAEFTTLLIELKADMANYLQELPADSKVPHKTLADLIAFNAANEGQELQYFNQDTFEAAEKQPGIDSASYSVSRELSLRKAGQEGLDQLMLDNKVDIIIAQTNGPAWISTLGKGDNFSGPSASTLPAIAGYPHLTVPMGMANGLPIGLSFIGGKWKDADVLAVGHVFEQYGPPAAMPQFTPAPVEPTTKPKKRRKEAAKHS
jgi:amidase